MQLVLFDDVGVINSVQETFHTNKVIISVDTQSDHRFVTVTIDGEHGRRFFDVPSAGKISVDASFFKDGEYHVYASYASRSETKQIDCGVIEARHTPAGELVLQGAKYDEGKLFAAILTSLRLLYSLKERVARLERQIKDYEGYAVP